MPHRPPPDYEKIEARLWKESVEAIPNKDPKRLGRTKAPRGSLTPSRLPRRTASTASKERSESALPGMTSPLGTYRATLPALLNCRLLVAQRTS